MIEVARLPHELLRAILVAALIFQGVISSAHLALAAAAPENGSSQVICTIHGAAPIDAPGDAPSDPDTPGTRACLVCASAHHLAGALVPALASLPAPAGRAFAAGRIARDQWPDGRQPRLFNARAPPRA